MKVVLFNGSPRKEGNTYHAMKMLETELQNEGIDTEILHIGGSVIRGCTACGMCAKNKDEKCVLNDEVNGWIQSIKDADGIILASPVYSADITGTMKSFLDRAFYVSYVNESLFRYKVGASVAVSRRSGGMPAFNQLNNYLTYSQMMIPTSNYWNVIYGSIPGDVNYDEEGKQILRVLGKNMAWLMKLVEAGKDTIKEPEQEKKSFMNFIR
ncbi:MAG: flavodoxin family protein [Acidaminobacteraceae bacterium]